MTLSAFSFLLCCLLCEVEVGFNAARSQMRYSTYYSLFTRVEFFMYQVKDERPAHHIIIVVHRIVALVGFLPSILCHRQANYFLVFSLSFSFLVVFVMFHEKRPFKKPRLILLQSVHKLKISCERNNYTYRIHTMMMNLLEYYVLYDLITHYF